MRKMISGSLVALALLVASAAPAEAQIPLGISVGPTFANLTGDEADGFDSKIGFFVSGGTSIAVGETFSIDPGVVYVQKGAEYAAGGDLSLDYFEIPVLVTASFPSGENGSFGFSLGPQVAFNVNCDDDGSDCSDETEFNSTEFGLVAGAHIGFSLSEAVGVSFGGGGDFGFTDPFDTVDASNTVYFLSAGLNFALGG